MQQPAQGFFIIIGSFVVAFILAALPLPETVNNWRPPWVALVLMYWCMALPNRVGIATGWFTGLLVDVLQGTLLGLNALSFSVLAYFSIVQYKRFRVSPLIQQAIIIGMLLLVLSLLFFWVRNKIEPIELNWSYCFPAITAILIWPWLFIILRDIRRYYKVS